jgi:hypothetical protein
MIVLQVWNDRCPKRGISSRTEAFIQAFKLLIRYYRIKKLKRRFESIREGTEVLPSVTEAIIASHKEEDLAW